MNVSLDTVATLSIVIPAFNEEGSIAGIIERLLTTRSALLAQGQVSLVEVIIVDDGSTDQTARIAQSFPDVRVVRHVMNRGYGAALKTGFQEASGDYIVFLDADASYRPESIPQVLQPALEGRADLVIGSRMMAANANMPTIRCVGNWFFARLLGWLTGQRITDSASGLRVFKRSVLPILFPLPDGLNLTPAMSARALHEGLRTVEVSIPYDERVGRSKLHVVRDGFRFLSSMVTVSRLYNPLKFFGIMGMGFLLAAGLLGIQPALHYVHAQSVEETAMYRLFTIMVLTVTGVNILTFGAFCNQALATLYPQRPPQRSFWADVLLHRRVVDSAGWVGLLFVAMAVILNRQTVAEYATTFHIHVHWSYLLAGATLFLIGVQLIMTRFFLTVLEKLHEADEPRGHLS